MTSLQSAHLLAAAQQCKAAASVVQVSKQLEEWAQRLEQHLTGMTCVQPHELADDAICIHAFMQATLSTGALALSNAAVAFQLAAESHQVRMRVMLDQAIMTAKV